MARILWNILFLATVGNLLIINVSGAAEVGRIAHVEGGVDILRNGKLPANPAKLNDIINSTDIIRTKSLSSAEIKFIDDSTITIAPGSRVAIEEYNFDAAKGERSATLKMFMGMVHTVVNKIYKAKEPDFIIKTQTAVIGVRGTDWYTLGSPYVTPNATDVYNGSGTTEVRNVFPEVPGSVKLQGMEVTRVMANLPPTLPMAIEMQDLKVLKKQLSPQLSGRSREGVSPDINAGTRPAITASRTGSSTAGNSLAQSTLSSSTDTVPAALLPSGRSTPTGAGSAGAISLVSAQFQPASPSATSQATNSEVQNVTNALFVPPMPVTPLTSRSTQTSAPIPVSSWDFSQYIYSYYYRNTTSPTTASYTVNSWGERTGVYPGYFTTSSSSNRTATTGTFGPSMYGASLGQMTGHVTGTLGGVLTGTMNYTIQASPGITAGSYTWSGSVTIQPDGTLRYSYTNGVMSSPGFYGTATGSGTQTPGTFFSQTATGSDTSVSNSPYDTATRTSIASYGSRTGVYPGTYSARYSGTSTASSSNSYRPTDQGAATFEIQGVVNGSTGAAQTGVAKMLVNGYNSSGTPDYLAGPVTIQPTGQLTATFHGTNPPFSGGAATQTVNLTQTAAPSPAPTLYNFTQNFSGAIGLNSSGSLYMNGWSQTTSGPTPSYATIISNGTTTQTGLTNSLLSGTITGSVTGIIGGGSPLTGNMSFTGSSALGYRYTYSGPVTLNQNGTMNFTYSGTWSSGVSSGTSSGTWIQNAGAFFTQSTSGTYISSNTSPPGVQVLTSDLSGLRTVVTPGPQTGSIALNLNTASTSIPAAGTVSTTTQGVVNGNPGANLQGYATTNINIGGATFITPGNVNIAPNGRMDVTLTTSRVNSGTVEYINGDKVSVPTNSGLTTSAYKQTVGGSYTQTVGSSSGLTNNVANISNPTASPLTGTIQISNSGRTQNIPVRGDLSITNTATANNTFTPASGNVAVTKIGVAAGPSGGVNSGPVQAWVTTTPTGSTPPGPASTITMSGTATLNVTSPVGASSTNLQGNNPVPPPPARGGVAATQTGTYTAK